MPKMSSCVFSKLAFFKKRKCGPREHEAYASVSGGDNVKGTGQDQTLSLSTITVLVVQITGM